MSKIINVWWYNTMQGGCIGIVKTQDEITGEVKFRIGIAPGMDEKLDAERIRDYGDTFDPKSIK